MYVLMCGQYGLRGFNWHIFILTKEQQGISFLLCNICVDYSTLTFICIIVGKRRPSYFCDADNIAKWSFNVNRTFGNIRTNCFLISFVLAQLIVECSKWNKLLKERSIFMSLYQFCESKAHKVRLTASHMNSTNALQMIHNTQLFCTNWGW